MSAQADQIHKWYAKAAANFVRIFLPTCLVVSPMLVFSLQRAWAVDKSSPSTRSDSSTARAMSVLRVNCLSCHNDEKKKGGLRLTSRENALKGSDNGPVLVPRKADKSLLAKVLLPERCMTVFKVHSGEQSGGGASDRAFEPPT